MAKKGTVNKTVTVEVKIGSYGFECPALENFDLKVIDGKLSINDMLKDGWSLEGIELRDFNVHPNPLKDAKKTTTKGKDLTDSDKFGNWYAYFSKPYPR